MTRGQHLLRHGIVSEYLPALPRAGHVIRLRIEKALRVRGILKAMNRASINRIFATVAVALAALCPARADGDGYFPVVRAHQEEYLARAFRLRVDALLTAGTPNQLVKQAAGDVPAFASAPVVGKLTDPFLASDDPRATGQPGPGAGGGDASDLFPAADGVGSDASDPFNSRGAASATTSVGGDPFAAGDDDAKAGEDPFADPFSGPAATGSGGDPFGGGGGAAGDDDDPFADF